MFIGTTEFIYEITDDIWIKVDDNDIKPRTQVKNLGFYMDRHMVFNAHIKMCRNGTGMLMYMNRINKYFGETTRIQVVQGLAQSTDYCLIWGITATQEEMTQNQ